MEIYNRLGEASSPEEVDIIGGEMEDRFGKMPLPAVWLCVLTKIRQFAALKGISYIKMDKITMTFEKQKGKVSHKQLVTLPSMKKPVEFEKAVIEILKN